MTHRLVHVQPLAMCSGPELETFIKVPWLVQRGDPYWVPPIISQQRHVLDPATGPFFEHGEAQYFLARQDKRVLGRISAHINRMHDERYADDTGFFGFFECVDDSDVATALFNAAAGWLRSRGRRRIRGPLSFGIYDEVGVLVEGFDSLPAILQTHNPPYYQRLIEAWGFQKAIDWYALRITDNTLDVAKMQQQLDQILAGKDLTITAPKPNDVFGERAREVFDIFNDAWSGNWGHVPFTWSEFSGILRELKPVLRSDLMRLILTPTNEIAAFIINVPDLNPELQKANGKLGPWRLLRLYLKAQWLPLGKLRTLLLGVRRDYQRRMLHHALILSCYIQLLKHPSITCCDCSLIPENLTMYLRSLARHQAKHYKTWRVFDRTI